MPFEKRLRLIFVAVGVLLASGPAHALKVRNTYGSPLDTLKNTKLTTDVPAAKDFVKETSPDQKNLNYTPLTGVDPDRPKPRDAAGVAALQSQLESAGARNVARARGIDNRISSASRPSRKTRAARGVERPSSLDR